MNKNNLKVTLNTYNILLTKQETTARVCIDANDNNHAQAQAADICRAFEADRFELNYSKIKKGTLYELFKRLAFNDFSYSNCFNWKGSYTNNIPCVYLFRKRFYVRPLIIRYLDMPLDYYVKTTCDNENCINPYHFKYVSKKNSKLTGGDLKLLLAYRGQGTGISPIAKALNVHRSTIYRNLKNECLPPGSADNRSSSNRR